jgi:hypothetical protein
MGGEPPKPPHDTTTAHKANLPPYEVHVPPDVG